MTRPLSPPGAASGAHDAIAGDSAHRAPTCTAAAGRPASPAGQSSPAPLRAGVVSIPLGLGRVEDVGGAVHLTFALRTVSGLNAREHWGQRTRRVRAERGRTANHLGLLGVARPSLPCVVGLVRIASRDLDDDNLRGALKAVRDEVAAWIGVDDRDPRVTWTYAQARCRRGEWGVRLEIGAAS